MKIGIISDTHNFLDPAIPRVFAGVGHILHAGDIGSNSIVRALEQIAPTSVVGGNTDDPLLGYPLTQVVELENRKFLLHHIVNPHQLTDNLRERIKAEQPDMVVFGHTHKAFSGSVGNQRFFNPGYAGKSRFGMQRSVAVLDLGARELVPAFVPLAG